MVKVHSLTDRQPQALAIIARNETDTEDESENIELNDEIITINVAGERFQTRASTLARFPNSLLGNPKKRRQFWVSSRREYFLDRHRNSFESILYIYQSYGHVLRPDTVPVYHFLNELKFYEGFVEVEERLMPKSKIQRAIFEFIEYPDSSLAARVVGFFSIFMIVLSLKLSEIFSTLWPSFLCTRTVLLKQFVMNFLYRSIFSADTHDGSFSVLRAIRLIRVVQVFKLSRHVIGLRVLGQTFRASLQEIILMGVFLVISLILFSSCIYFAEQNEPNSKFTSIPASFWFVLATITTVGFGDLVPVTPTGEFIGSLVALLGVMTLTFPISIIITNFKQYYRQAYRLASLNAEDLQRAAEEVRAWKQEEAEHGKRNGIRPYELDLPNDNGLICNSSTQLLFLGSTNGTIGPPQLYRKNIAPLHWLGSHGSMSSADDALYV
ncbi:BTB domain-containing protein [Aphelenchoides besseyi]|nr:BTB domain-containing protein [Aphelenchoides besseyi]